MSTSTSYIEHEREKKTTADEEMETGKKTVKLKSADNEVFEVELEVALQSQVIKDTVDDMDCSAVPLPLPNISSAELAKILEFCRYHHHHPLQQQQQAAAAGTPASAYHKQFLSSLTKKDLFGLMLAANYLDIASLLDVLCGRVANKIKKMTPEEVRKYFGIANDFTPEEESQVRRENQWAFD
ncbi:hypothetical protein L7F22_000807 [Adiantum nelumboides]|nr:hypothetical protein [Adiantum nelumboides]